MPVRERGWWSLLLCQTDWLWLVGGEGEGQADLLDYSEPNSRLKVNLIRKHVVYCTVAPFYRWANWGSGKESGFPSREHTGSRGARTWSQGSSNCMLPARMATGGWRNSGPAWLLMAWDICVPKKSGGKQRLLSLFLEAFLRWLPSFRGKTHRMNRTRPFFMRFQNIQNHCFSKRHMFYA